MQKRLFEGRLDSLNKVFSSDSLKEASLIDSLRHGLLLERAGNYKEALMHYRVASKAESDSIKLLAKNGIERVDNKLYDPFGVVANIENVRNISVIGRL